MKNATVTMTKLLAFGRIMVIWNMKPSGLLHLKD